MVIFHPIVTTFNIADPEDREAVTEILARESAEDTSIIMNGAEWAVSFHSYASFVRVNGLIAEYNLVAA